MNGRQILLEFLRLWKEKFGRSYPVAWGKDTAIFNRILRETPGPELLEIVGYYLRRHSSDWCVRCGYSTNALVSELPVLTARLAEEQQKNEKAQEGNPDFERLEKARNEGTQ